MDKKPSPENAPPGEVKTSSEETPEKQNDEIFETEDIEMEPTQDQDPDDQDETENLLKSLDSKVSEIPKDRSTADVTPV